MKFILVLQKKLLHLEKILLVTMFIVTLSIAVLQIILRNFFDTGIIWGDSFLRISVLWIGMMGALYASRGNNHISIDLGVKFLAKKNLNIIKAVIHLFTSLVCALVAWYGFNLVIMEYEYSEIAFAIVPVWLTIFIIPIVFFIMSLRYLSFSILIFTGREHDIPFEDKTKNIEKDIEKISKKEPQS